MTSHDVVPVSSYDLGGPFLQSSETNRETIQAEDQGVLSFCSSKCLNKKPKLGYIPRTKESHLVKIEVMDVGVNQE